MEDELDGRIAAMEMALLTVITALEDIPETAIAFRLRHTRARIEMHDPESPRTLAALETFDRFLPLSNQADD